MSAAELLEGTVNTVEIKHEDGKPSVYLNGRRMNRLRGYHVKPDVRLRDGRFISHVTLEFISNDITVDGKQIGGTEIRQHVDDGSERR